MFGLRRITSDGRFIAEIDGLRFVAIASVVAFHFYVYLRVKLNAPSGGIAGLALQHGDRGVALFFAISGFILGRPFAMHYIRGAPKPNLRAYFLRRLTRLEPPYIITLVVCFFALAAHSGGPSHLLASTFYLHNAIYGTRSTVNSVAWSLEVEVQFYCLIPLLAAVYKYPRAVRRSLLAAAMFVGTFHLLAMPERISMSILGCFQYFAAGLLLADLYVDGWNDKQHWGFDAISVALWPAVFFMSQSLTWVLMPVCALALYIAAFRSLVFRKFFTATAIATIGGMCYTVYLIHSQVIALSGKLSHNPITVVVLSIFGLVVCSLAFFVLVERPCMDKDWPSKLLSLLRPSWPVDVERV